MDERQQIDLLRAKLQRMVDVFDSLPIDFQRHYRGSVIASIEALEATAHEPDPIARELDLIAKSAQDDCNGAAY